jgi:hypothetical protein
MENRPVLSQRRKLGTLTPSFLAISPIVSVAPASLLSRDQV